MADLSQVTYCGLYCGLCSMSGRIPERSRRLRDAMKREGWDFWGTSIPGFEPFWKFLEGLVEGGADCGCREGKCGPPFCGIRKCAQAKSVEVCVFCGDYPCRRILGIAKGYVTLLADGQRMKEVGLDAWIAEQEARKRTGFAYCDIRCEPYEISAD
jgi:hypothetical protein